MRGWSSEGIAGRGRGTAAAVVTAVAVALLAAGCGTGDPAQSSAAGDGLRVVATTTIVGDLVTHLGGDRVTVDVLMGPGIDPHLYKPSAGDVRRLSAAQAVFFNGLHLEGRMTEVLEQAQRRGIRPVPVAECVPPERRIAVEGFGGLFDPHVWFDVGLWREAVSCAAAALAELDPEGRAGYEARAADYVAELDALDGWVREQVARIPPESRVLVTAHDAFAYFGRAYGLEVLGLLGVSTASEAGAGDVQRLADTIAERRIPAVFVETSVSPRYVQALREAVAARAFDVALGGSLYSDSLGSPGGPAATYLGTVRANVETIVGALSDGPPPDGGRP